MAPTGHRDDLLVFSPGPRRFCAGVKPTIGPPAPTGGPVADGTRRGHRLHRDPVGGRVGHVGQGGRHGGLTGGRGPPPAHSAHGTGGVVTDHVLSHHPRVPATTDNSAQTGEVVPPPTWRAVHGFQGPGRVRARLYPLSPWGNGEKRQRRVCQGAVVRQKASGATRLVRATGRTRRPVDDHRARQRLNDRPDVLGRNDSRAVTRRPRRLHTDGTATRPPPAYTWPGSAPSCPLSFSL